MAERWSPRLALPFAFILWATVSGFGCGSHSSPAAFPELTRAAQVLEGDLVPTTDGRGMSAERLTTHDPMLAMSVPGVSIDSIQLLLPQTGPAIEIAPIVMSIKYRFFEHETEESASLDRLWVVRDTGTDSSIRINGKTVDAGSVVLLPRNSGATYRMSGVFSVVEVTFATDQAVRKFDVIPQDALTTEGLARCIGDPDKLGAGMSACIVTGLDRCAPARSACGSGRWCGGDGPLAILQLSGDETVVRPSSKVSRGYLASARQDVLMCPMTPGHKTSILILTIGRGEDSP